MEHQYLLTLRGANGRPAALLRLKQGPGGYAAERRDYIPLPREAALWLFTPGGPVPVGEAKPAPLLGAALAEGGRCLCAGAARGARIDLPRELLRLRLLLQAELSPRAKPAPAEGIAIHEAQRPEPAIQPEPMEEAMAAPMQQEEWEETPMDASAAEPGQGAMADSAEDTIGDTTEDSMDFPMETAVAEATEASREESHAPAGEPPVPVMVILPEPERGIPDGYACEADVNTEADSMLYSTANEYGNSWNDAPATEESYDHVPEGAEEVSGREYGWSPGEEAERRALWIAGETTAETYAEYDADLEMEGSEDEDMPEGGSEALQDILARAERAFSDHVPPSPTPVLPDGLNPMPGPAPDPIQAREGLAMPIPNPFPNTFPEAEFRRVHRPQGQGWYLQGEMRRGNERWRITAMPGEYRPIPPCALQGFHRYIKSRDGGYWLRIERQG